MMFLHILVLACIVSATNGCGIVTHIEISHRAKTYFKDDSGSSVDYAKMIRKHNDALMAGSPYPDSFYSDICANGDYHDVSEDTHWAPFLNATVNYIREKYPQPWDDATEKLVVFTFGIVSHQVADILWHNLGIQQGFLQSMANINYNGHFDEAHPVGDFGGDILTDYEMDLDYIPLDQGWYIPVEDLNAIYNKYNGTSVHMPSDVILDCSVITYLARYIPVDDLNQIYINYYNGNYTRMPKSILQECSQTLFIARLAEVLEAKKLIDEDGDTSPFLVDQFEKFFIGGVDDMAGWTNRIWQQTATMLEKGTSDCDIPKSTLFLHCNTSTPKLSGYRKPGKNGYFKLPSMKSVSYDDVIVTKELRGIRIKPSPSFIDKLKRKRSESSALKFESNLKSGKATVKSPDNVLFVANENARLGESYATGDLNFDGKPDIVITAPGYGTSGSPQEGRVYIVYGDDNGLPETLNPDLDTLESTGQGQILKGWGTAQSRFGTSVAVMDINLDGADDIAIGSPAYVDLFESPLQYNGYVMVYFGIPQKKIVANGAANITIVCKKVQYCNLGYSMTSGDIDGDGNPDLIIGTPFAPNGGEQRGFVAGLFASKLNTGYQYMDVGELKWGISGDQSDAWFGYNLQFGKWNNNNVLFVSQPEYRQCYYKNCTLTALDKQALGRLNGYYGNNLTKNWTVEGDRELYQLGWSADIGNPYPDKTRQVIAVSAPDAFVYGSMDFVQAGHVLLFNTTNGSLPPTKKPMAKLEGDRRIGRFGYSVKFWDVNNDGMDDLLISAPFRSDDFTTLFFGPDQGLVFVYMGGENFPTLPDCGKSFIKPCPLDQATYVLQWTDRDSKMRFGTNMARLKFTKSSQVFVTAQHNSNFARLGGAVGVFNF
ncbi:Glycosylphosphatidylinositol specific phospholipase D1 [Mactra antiquata]